MYGSNKNKIINKLRQGYTPVEISPKKELSSTFKNIFKPIVKRKDLDFFFELYNMEEVILKAWGFLGIYHILEEKNDIQEEDQAKLHSIVIDLLSEKSEIKYYGGSIESRSTLREHHVTRLVDLDNSLILEPVLKYVKSFKGTPDSVIMELLEHVLSNSSENTMEEVILNCSRLIESNAIRKKISIVKSFENLGQSIVLQQKRDITSLFKEYLAFFEDQVNVDTDILSKKRELEELIFKVGAELELELEKETLQFIDSLEYPYDSLDIVATKYRKNKEFQSILLTKLQKSENPHFIVEVLKAILVLKDEISDWKNLIIDNVKKYQLIDGDLISAMEKSNLISEKMILSFLNKADDWSLKFVREYLIQNPTKLSEWRELNDLIVEKLKTYTSSEDTDVIEFIFSLIIDLELKNFLEYSLNTFKRIESDKLKKMAIFPILKFGEERLLLKLKDFMKENQETGKFVMQFLNRLERNEWRFYY
ncbi:MAG: hypothetical protein EU531_03620 [Promethearchaeota archaeon]|nr:MAG: hypothetical protein EU531_03620 [Candidatus Lokiarchaeota archaeon]